jgi:transposase
MQCFGPLSRRLFVEAPRPRRHARAADPHRADPGQLHDSMMAEELIRARGRALIADTGYDRYDADRFVAAVRAKGMTPVIHCNPTRKRKRRLNRKLYGIRYHVKCFIHRIKRFRAVPTRYEKTARNYLVQLVCAFVWLI